MTILQIEVTIVNMFDLAMLLGSWFAILFFFTRKRPALVDAMDGKSPLIRLEVLVSNAMENKVDFSLRNRLFRGKQLSRIYRLFIMGLVLVMAAFFYTGFHWVLLLFPIPFIVKLVAIWLWSKGLQENAWKLMRSQVGDSLLEPLGLTLILLYLFAAVILVVTGSVPLNYGFQAKNVDLSLIPLGLAIGSVITYSLPQFLTAFTRSPENWEEMKKSLLGILEERKEGIRNMSFKDSLGVWQEIRDALRSSEQDYERVVDLLSTVRALLWFPFIFGIFGASLLFVSGSEQWIIAGTMTIALLFFYQIKVVAEAMMEIKILP